MHSFDLPEKTGCSRGPVTCRTPRSAPPTGMGKGLMPRVRRKSFISTEGTEAVKRYWPEIGSRSMSPAWKTVSMHGILIHEGSASLRKALICQVGLGC